LQIDFLPIAKGDAAKAVPFRLVLPVLARGKLLDRFGLQLGDKVVLKTRSRVFDLRSLVFGLRSLVFEQTKKRVSTA
jgi:hypothetical protein